MEMAQQVMRGCLFLCLLSVGTQQQQTCIRSYNFSQGIALLESSFQQGARLLEVSRVNTSLACLECCCSTQDCDLAVLEEGKAGDEHTCILVKCFSEHKPVCTFGPRAGFQSHSRSVSLQKAVDPAASSPVDCSSPAVTGPCRASFPRWNYDASDKTCREFTYGGCLGNGNNFMSREECTKVCDRVTVNAVPVSLRSVQTLKEQCSAPVEVGKCRAAFPRWYFNTQTQSCKKFTYGGCKGNRNNYESEAQCMATCAGRKEVVVKSHSLRGDVGGDEFCYAPVVTGNCRAAFPRWYYDLDSQRCQRFVYGGCGGNKNNYDSEAECLAMCAGQSGTWKPVNSGKAEHHIGIRHQASAILMVVLLSLCILVLLMGVIYFIVRLTKTDHIVSYQRAPRGEDKENLINTVQNL